MTKLRAAAVMGCVVVCALVAAEAMADVQARAAIDIRGHSQALVLYGARGERPVIVSSGDGGWIHLGPHVADILAERGYFVVGFDTRAYLESFTSDTGALREDEVREDYKQLADFAARGSASRPILIGVSEGAGLSALAATSPETRNAIAGVIGLGLTTTNELGWRWRDAVTYLTHGTPHEPTFSSAAVVPLVSPAPLAAIHATGDEFAPIPQIRTILDAARAPKRLWVVNASDHRFSDNLDELDRCLLEAITWVTDHAAR